MSTNSRFKTSFFKTHSEPSPRHSDGSDNGDETMIYDTPRALQPRQRPMLVPEMESFENFVERSNITFSSPSEDSPLLGRKSNSSPKARRKRRPQAEHYYFNMEAARNNENMFDSALASPMWNERAETEGESDATNLSETESLLARRRIIPIEHDYVNNEAFLPRSKHSSKSSKASNNYSNTGVRNSQFSDSSAYEIELGAMIYSSPPSKKSSSSNLS